MEAPSYYRASATAGPLFAALQGAVETETCVVGGGLAGLNTALGLAERGQRDVVLLESETIGHGASGRNGGFVFGGFSRGEGALLADLGPDRAKALYRGTQDAVGLIRQRIGRYDMACQATDAGVLWANWFKDPAPLLARQRLLSEHYGVEWEWVPRRQLAEMVRSDRYGDGLFERNALHFNPLAYAQGVATAAAGQGVRVHERSPALSLAREGAGWRVNTPEGSVSARTVVLACGGYLAKLRTDVDAGVLPIATYVMVTEPLGARLQALLPTRAAVYDSRFAFDYYRALPDTRLLWGGRISVRDRDAGAVKRLLYRDMLRVFPSLDGVRLDYAWSGLMSYARHQMPQVGRIDEGLWLAQAFGGHGVAPTTFAGELLAAGIVGQNEQWRRFSDYGLVSALKPAGFVAAQLEYWWLQARDAWKDFREGRR